MNKKLLIILSIGVLLALSFGIYNYREEIGSAYGFEGFTGSAIKGNGINEDQEQISKESNSEIIKLKETTLTTCNLTTEGEIRYNGTSHYGCDGSSWHILY